ncbi:MAG: hypothetical protein Q8862_10140 [Bacteroidota bacterium]|nr:hypothetical protein [Bacteroidota bacterium]
MKTRFTNRWEKAVLGVSLVILTGINAIAVNDTTNTRLDSNSAYMKFENSVNTNSMNANLKAEIRSNFVASNAARIREEMSKPVDPEVASALNSYKMNEIRNHFFTSTAARIREEMSKPVDPDAMNSLNSNMKTQIRNDFFTSTAARIREEMSKPVDPEELMLDNIEWTNDLSLKME